MIVRPSSSVSGSRAKLLFSSTKPATVLLAWLPVAHGDAQMRVFDRQHVVDAIANHGDKRPCRLQRLHDLHLLLRRHAAENAAVRINSSRIRGLVQLRCQRRPARARAAGSGAPTVARTVSGLSPERTLKAMPWPPAPPAPAALRAAVRRSARPAPAAAAIKPMSVSANGSSSTASANNNSLSPDGSSSRSASLPVATLRGQMIAQRLAGAQHQNVFPVAIAHADGLSPILRLERQLIEQWHLR